MKKLIICLFILASNIFAYPNYVEIINATEYDIQGFYMVNTEFAKDTEWRWGKSMIKNSIPSKTGKRLNLWDSGYFDIKVVFEYNTLYFFNNYLKFAELNVSTIEITISNTGVSIKKAT